MSLDLRHVACHYDEKPAVQDVSFTAENGEIICLYGPSGCGKTTLLRLIAGLEAVTAGEIALDGEILSGPGIATPAEARAVGLVFQDYVLFPHMTVAQNIAFGLDHMPARERRLRIAQTLQAVGLEGYEKRFPQTLSGGEQQRAAIARAFAREPGAMLLDEPFASIDTVLRRRLRADIRGILKARAAPAIIVTHDPEEALALGDRIALMKAGRIIELATPAELFKNPQTPEGAAIFPGAQTLAGDVAGGVFSSAFGDVPVSQEGAADMDGPALGVVRSGAARAVAGAGVLVCDCSFQGPGWRVLVEAEGVRLETESEAPAQIGAMVDVAFDPAGVHVFGA